MIEAGLGIVEFGRRDIQGNPYLFAWPVARFVDRFQDQVQGFHVAAQVRGKTAFIADGRIQFLRLQHFLQVVKDLDATAQGLAETRRNPAA